RDGPPLGRVVEDDRGGDAVGPRQPLRDGVVDGEDGVGAADVPPLDGPPPRAHPRPPGRGIEGGVELAGVEGEAGAVAAGGVGEGGEGVEVAGEVEGGGGGEGGGAEPPVGGPEEAGAAAGRRREDAGAEAVAERE